MLNSKTDAAQSTQSKLPDVGQQAPDFSVVNQDQKVVTLHDLSGHWTVLYFYPKDLTSGCTIQANDFTALRPHFDKLDVCIYGVSPDEPQMHCRFIEKEKLRLSLLSDPQQSMLKSYGVWQLKQNYGKEYYGVVRSTFILDPSGQVAKVWTHVKAEGHAQEVLDTLTTLIASAKA